MSEIEAAESRRIGREGLTREERKSVTHGDFWIPEEEREKYKRALDTLNREGIPYVVSGAYAIYEHTGIYRETKDLDLFLDPGHIVDAALALREEGFVSRIEQPHWLAKATLGDHFVDLIFGMGNGLALIDEDWYRHSKPAILAARPVRVAPVEELIWHRLFISERHRHDMSDIVHVILCRGDSLDWRRLVDRVDQNWPLLLSQLLMFSYVYTGHKGNIPAWVPEKLLENAHENFAREEEDVELTRGPMISRFSFTIDVREWGFSDPRSELVKEARNHPLVRAIIDSDVWDERGEVRAEPRDDTPDERPPLAIAPTV